MASKLPPIGTPNYRGIAGMDPGDLIKVREYYIVRAIKARREKDHDTFDACWDWLDALVSEMRLRGTPSEPTAPGIIAQA